MECGRGSEGNGTAGASDGTKGWQEATEREQGLRGACVAGSPVERHFAISSVCARAMCKRKVPRHAVNPARSGHGGAVAIPDCPKPHPKVERPKRTLDARSKPPVAVGVPITFTRKNASAQTVGAHCRGCGWVFCLNILKRGSTFLGDGGRALWRWLKLLCECGCVKTRGFVSYWGVLDHRGVLSRGLIGHFGKDFISGERTTRTPKRNPARLT